MAARLLSLLAVACACGAGAALVSGARADQAVPAARLPAIPAAAPVGTRCPIPARLRPAFEQAARDTRVPLALLTAVARVESELPHARASRRAGSVVAGARYLRSLLDRFTSRNTALAAYDAGAKAAASGVAPSAETLTYVADVTSIWRSLEGCT